MDISTKKASANHIRRFKRLVTGLQNLIDDMHNEGIDEAEIYMGARCLHLMNGLTHDRCGNPLYENIACSVKVYHMGGGDW